MSQVRLGDPNVLVNMFDVDIAYSRSEVAEKPPEQTARETLDVLAEQGDFLRVFEIAGAAEEINKIVLITQRTGQETIGLIDIFTSTQIEQMSQRVHDYLGTDIDTHLTRLSRPPGYPFYVGKLATYFTASDRLVTSGFGGFELRHTDPTQNATGPLERNSREYANYANDLLLRQFSKFYQASFDISLVGPTRTVEGSRISWERGIAECQFLVLDYVRDLLAAGHSSNTTRVEADSMTIEDVESNIRALLLKRPQIYKELFAINPLLASQFNDGIDKIADFTVEEFSRGRMGVPRFKKEPNSARESIRRVESLLIQAAGLAQDRADQADIPILDI